MIHVRQATPLDARQMAGLLTDMLAQGDSRRRPVDPAEVQAEMRLYPGRTAWILAETDKAELLGFQQIGPHPDLPPDAAEIATFVRPGRADPAIGALLFEATRKRARRLGYAWINATIRADNAGGLTYYQSRGFEDHARRPGPDGNRICKRYDLSR